MQTAGGHKSLRPDARKRGPGGRPYSRFMESMT
jgi:hypothetical protein